MVMPTNPTTDFVMIQPSFAVAGLEQFFDAMPLSLGTDHFGQGHFGAAIAQSVVDLRFADGSQHDQTFLRTDTAILLGLDPNHYRLDFQWALFGVANGQACPPRLRLTLRPSVDPLKGGFAFAAASFLTASRRSAFQVADQGVTWDVEHIAFLALSQLTADLRRPTKIVIARNPTMGQAGQAPVQQIQRDPPLLLKLDFGGYMAFRSTCFVSRPILGQAELSVQRAITRRGGVSQEHADLAVVHLPQPTAPLTADAAGFSPLLGEGAGVDNHDAIRAFQFFADMGAQLSHHSLVVPLARADEELDRFARQPGLDGDWLTGLALQTTDKAAYDQGGVDALLDAIELGQVTLEELD